MPDRSAARIRHEHAAGRSPRLGPRGTGTHRPGRREPRLVAGQGGALVHRARPAVLGVLPPRRVRRAVRADRHGAVRRPGTACPAALDRPAAAAGYPDPPVRRAGQRRPGRGGQPGRVGHRDLALGQPAVLGQDAPRQGPVRPHRPAAVGRDRRRAATGTARGGPCRRPGRRPRGARGAAVDLRHHTGTEEPDAARGCRPDIADGEVMNNGARVETLPVYEVGRLGRAVLDQVGTVVVGKRAALELVLAGILAGGHVLLEDLPGLGKTLTARCFAQALGIEFRRLQFTPDLLPADVTGSFLYDQRHHDFTFRAGPVFTNLLLADEINRTPPKTQAALLEAMQAKQVSVEGTTYRLPPPFHLLATANPIEYQGTYPLPEAQLDRFLLRGSFGYPDRDEEWAVLRRRIARRQEESFLEPVVDAQTLLAMQA